VSTGKLQERGRFAPLTDHIPQGQFLRYLVVGGWNTLFGFGSYAFLTAVLDRHFSHGYILANLLASLINITVSFLGYKWFVFKTTGNYFREWLRSVAVYSTAIIIGTAALPGLVRLIRHSSRLNAAAPYVAGALVMSFSVLYSFLGHRKFSFRVDDNIRRKQE